MQAFTLVSTQREQLFRETALRISQSVSVQTILDAAVWETRQLLQADRVLVYQFNPDMSGRIIAESVAEGWQILLDQQIEDTCFQRGGGSQFPQDYRWAVGDIYQAGLTECHLQLLETFQVRANIVVPILVLDRLWGLLIVHQCGQAREWQPDELALIDQLAVYLVIALQQTTLHQQLQAELMARQQVEIRLQSSEQRYATLLATAPVGIFCTDAVGNCTYVNDRWCQITGLTPEAALGEGWQNGLHPDDRNKIATEWARSAQENRPFELEYRFQHPDGTVTQVVGQSTAEQDANGQVVGYVSIITDINQRKRSEAALQESEAHQRALMKALPDLIARINRRGIYLEFVATPNFHVVGNLSDLAGSHVSESLPPHLAQRRLKFIQLALQTNLVQTYEQDLSVDGRLQIEEVRVVPYSQDEVLLLIRDISDRKHAEFALQQSEAKSRAVLAAIPDLIFRVGADGIYHEFITEQRNFRMIAPGTNPIGQSMLDLLPTEHAQRQLYYLQQAMQTGELQIYEQTIQVGDQLQDEEVRVVKSGEDEALFMVRDITDRKRAETALQQSELTNRTIIETIPDLLIQMNRHGQCSRMVGGKAVRVQYPSTSPTELEVDAVLPPDLAAQRLHYANQAIESNRLQIYEQVLNVEGDLRYEEVRIAPLNAEEVLTIVRDITDRKQAENALQYLVESTAAVTGKDFFSTLAQQLILALKVQSVIVSELVEDRLQTLAFWMDGKPQPQISFALAEAPCWASAIEQGQFYCPQGLQQRFSKYPFIQSLQAESYLGMPLISANGRKLGNLCILDNKPMENVHWAAAFLRIFAMRAAAELERQQATEALEQLNQELEVRVEQRTAALRANEAKLSAIFNQAAVGMKLTTPDGQYLKVNQKLCDILGYTQEEFSTKSSQEIAHPEDEEKREAKQQQLYAGAINSFSIEERYLHKQGSSVWTNLTVSLVRKPSGEPDYVISVMEDISDRKQAEAQLQKAHDHLLVTNAELAQATQLKTEFLANMSHELRTPLNAVLGMSEGLLEEVYGPLNDRQKKSVTIIGQSGSHLLALINDVLDLAKIESGKLELQLTTISIQNLCESSLTLVRQMAHKKQIQLTTKIPQDLGEIQVDDRRIRQVLVNLLSNAVKFTPNGGHVVLEAQIHSQQQALCFSVSDTGIGIAAEHLIQLFQPFVQIDSSLNREYEGTGLGLALVRHIVELHGGSVGVVSEVGQGSRFSILLPWQREAKVATEIPVGDETEDMASDQSLRLRLSTQAPLILLSEDNEANIETVSSYLLAQGYRLIKAKNGLEAVAMAKIHQPHLILMDIQTPEMDGLEATRQIRADLTLAEIPIIALTALAMSSDRDRCLEAGANEYLTKPIRLRHLLTCIQKLLST